MPARPRWDPHSNLFYYYRAGGSDTERERQLENNTTKAFIHILQRHPGIAASLFGELGMEIDPSGTKFALQRTPINSSALEHLKNRYVLGVSPDGDIGTASHSMQRTVPDAWVWSENTVVAFENKTAEPLDSHQLEGHRVRISAPSTNIVTASWVEINDILNSMPGKMPGSSMSSPTIWS
jgi:hypothetical protein